MNFKKTTILFVFTVFVFVTHAQKRISPTASLSFDIAPVIAYNSYSNTYLAFADSTSYWEFSNTKNSWQKKPLICDLDIPFQQFIEEFVPLGVSKQELFFVHNSCGSVYSFSKGKIQRIDNSFIHKNQFGATIYEYNGTLYFFGGYGFFENKNTHDFYLRSANEWYAVSNTTTPKPSPRSNAVYIKGNNRLFLLSGEVNTTAGHYQLSDCWEYELSSNKWALKGELTSELMHLIKRSKFSNYSSSPMLLANDQLIVLNPVANRFTVYSNPFYSSIVQLFADCNEKRVLVLSKASNGSKHKATIYTYNAIFLNKQFSNRLYDRPSFLTKLSFKYLFYSAAIICVFLVLLLLYKPTLIVSKLHKNSVLHEHQFYPIEWQVLKILSNHPQVELAALNHLFDEEDLNYETLKKRRETLLNSLRKKLAYITHLKYNDVFIETKHAADKRVKCITLNDNIKLHENQDFKIG
jgi:hypothetical protein